MTELVRVQGPHLFTQTNHTSIWKVVCVKFLNLTSTFVWNFLDVFIMTISIALSTQFELFNRELIRTKNEVIYYQKNNFLCANYIFFWVTAYICIILEISAITIQKIMWFGWYSRLTDIARNFTVVLQQYIFYLQAAFSELKVIFKLWLLLFDAKWFFHQINCFRSLPTIHRMVYFWYSLIFLLMRTLAVSFFAARINDESKKSIKILRDLNTHSWNNETNRFFNEVIYDTVALSGMRFFFLTRKLILTVS